MFLKTLFTLLSILVLNDGGGDSGDGGNEASQNGNGSNAGNQNQGGDGAEGASNGQGARTDAATTTNSINRQIKDFAAKRGITVEALLSSYEELENAGKTELERLQGERDTLLSERDEALMKVRDANARTVVADAASKAGAVSPNLIYRAVKDDLEFDKSGSPTNVDAVISDLRSTEPSQFRAAGGSGDGGQGGGNNNTPQDMSALLRSMAGRRG